MKRDPKKTKRLRRTVDVLMTALLPCLMAYSLIGETLHEIAGVGMLALFITHHFLNRGWLKGLLRGRYTPYRVFTTVINLLLCLVMLCLPLSGILMSKHLFRFLPTAGLSSLARTTHLLCSYWGFALMSLHLGLHLDAMLKKRPKWLSAVAIAAALYGIYAFIKRGLPGYMTLRTAFVFFDHAEPRLFFFVDYLTIMALFAVAGYWAGKLQKPKGVEILGNAFAKTVS